MMNNLIKMENGNAVLNAEISSQIAEFERQVKSIKAQEETLKKAILKAMEDNNIIRPETDDITVSYVASTDRETLDSKSLRNDLPDIYDEYIRITKVKPSIRIKVK